MEQKQVWIDKTGAAEEMLETSRGLCLCGMPGLGKKTMVRMLLERHPEVYPCAGSLDQLRPPEERQEKKAVWYLVRGLSFRDLSGLAGQLRQIFSRMEDRDRIIFVTEGEIPEELLEFVWNGSLSLVYPDSFWFTREETERYLKEYKSPLNRESTYRLTRGWPGLLALLVRIQRQLPECWQPEELCARFEVRQFIRGEILGSISEEERDVMVQRACFPRLNRELEQLLWKDPRQETEEKLFMRGILFYQPGKSSWYVHPAIRLLLGEKASPEQYRTALVWYERKGLKKEALECCGDLGDREELRKFLVRNYTGISWALGEERFSLGWTDPDIPELLYLKWMEVYFRQESGEIRKYAEYAGSLLLKKERDEIPQKQREIYLNIAYVNPEVSMTRWMGLLEQYSRPGERMALYYTLGESVSFLCGLRDLTELFACEAEERKRYERLWKERMDARAFTAYRLAGIEFAFLTDRLSAVEHEFRSLMEEIGEDSPWQFRMGKLYMLFLLSESGRTDIQARKLSEKLWRSLIREENEICRYNGMALYYLTEARWGKREDIIQWIKETGGDLANKAGRTQMHLAAQVKVQMYLGNYGQAGRILEELILYLKKNRGWKFWAEALFQKAICERELGRESESLKWMTESLRVAEPFRYVRIYTGFGKKGRLVLENYRSMMEESDTHLALGKRPYQYGNVRSMPYMTWIDYLIRKARKNEHAAPGERRLRKEELHVDKLTLTERMILQYLSSGYRNQEIGQEMNIKVSTVKSHVYSIYKKLGVSNRIQAVQRGREEGIL